MGETVAVPFFAAKAVGARATANLQFCALSFGRETGRYVQEKIEGRWVTWSDWDGAHARGSVVRAGRGFRWRPKYPVVRVWRLGKNGRQRFPNGATMTRTAITRYSYERGSPSPSNNGHTLA